VWVLRQGRGEKGAGGAGVSGQHATVAGVRAGVFFIADHSAVKLSCPNCLDRPSLTLLSVLEAKGGNVGREYLQ
jgi:hypothetical protein